MPTYNELRRTTVRKDNLAIFLVIALFSMLSIMASLIAKTYTHSSISSEIHNGSFNEAGGIMRNSVEDTLKPGRETKSNFVPFILRLSQTGEGKVTTILDSTKSVQIRSGFVTLLPGENVGSHNTGEHEELLVILDGNGRVEAQWLGKKNIGKGMIVYIPPNNQHNVYCTGSSPLRYIYVVAQTK